MSLKDKKYYGDIEQLKNIEVVEWRNVVEAVQKLKKEARDKIKLVNKQIEDNIANAKILGGFTVATYNVELEALIRCHKYYLRRLYEVFGTEK